MAEKFSILQNILKKISSENRWNPEIKPFTAYFHLISTLLFDIFMIFSMIFGVIKDGTLWWLFLFIPIPLILGAGEIYFFLKQDFAIRYFTMASAIIGFFFLLAVLNYLPFWIIITFTIIMILMFCKNYNDTRFMYRRNRV